MTNRTFRAFAAAFLTVGLALSAAGPSMAGVARTPLTAAPQAQELSRNTDMALKEARAAAAGGRSVREARRWLRHRGAQSPELASWYRVGLRTANGVTVTVLADQACVTADHGGGTRAHAGACTRADRIPGLANVRSVRFLATGFHSVLPLLSVPVMEFTTTNQMRYLAETVAPRAATVAEVRDTDGDGWDDDGRYEIRLPAASLCVQVPTSRAEAVRVLRAACADLPGRDISTDVLSYRLRTDAQEAAVTLSAITAADLVRPSELDSDHLNEAAVELAQGWTLTRTGPLTFQVDPGVGALVAVVEFAADEVGAPATVTILDRQP